MNLLSNLRVLRSNRRKLIRKEMITKSKEVSIRSRTEGRRIMVFLTASCTRFHFLSLNELNPVLALKMIGESWTK
jgi:hypothetical protein